MKNLLKLNNNQVVIIFLIIIIILQSIILTKVLNDKSERINRIDYLKQYSGGEFFGVNINENTTLNYLKTVCRNYPTHCKIATEIGLNYVCDGKGKMAVEAILK